MNLTFAIGLILYAKKHDRFLGLNTIGYSFLASATAFIILGSRNLLPEVVSTILPNGLIVLAISLLYIGISEFYQVLTRSMIWRCAMMILITLASSFMLIYLTDNKPLAVVIISLMFVFVYSAIARTILVSDLYDDKFARYFFGYTNLLWATYFVVRTLTSLIEYLHKDFITPGLMHSLAIVVYQSLVISTSFSLIWIVSSKLESELAHQASHDALTNIYNRRALDEIANKECSRSTRYKTPLSVIMLDIDHFKKLNDTYGHPTGDKALVDIATLLKDSLRIHDTAARYGGEEFILVLPNTNIDEAELIADKLRIAISEHSFFDKKGNELKITSSFGIASQTTAIQSWPEIINQADKALYEAKHSGRNTVSRDK